MHAILYIKWWYHKNHTPTHSVFFKFDGFKESFNVIFLDFDTYLRSWISNSDEWWITKLRANALDLSDLWTVPPKIVAPSPWNIFRSISGITNGSNVGMLSSGIPKFKQYYYKLWLKEYEIENIYSSISI